FARFVLEDKAPQIADAVAPGGSGNPTASLNTTEKAVFDEVSKFGIPLRAWEDYRYLLGLEDPNQPPGGVIASDLLSFLGIVKAIDRTYADDFWTKPGYLGTEQSPLGELI